MNIVEFNRTIKEVRNWIKENEIQFVGDKSPTKINQNKIVFGEQVVPELTIEVGNVGVDYVKSGSAGSAIGFTFGKELKVQYLPEIIGCTSYYNGNHDSTRYESIPLNQTNFVGELILIVTWECDDWGNEEASYTLHPTPNLKKLREEAEKEDEARWVSELGAKNSGRR
jgi:hypothetical protein